MKKIKKGDYGYRNHFKRKQLFIIALLALFIIAQLVGRSFTDNDSVKKILTVMAIVTVLPAANLASPLIAIFKYHTPEQAFHEAYMPYEEKFEVLYDLVLTTPEDVIPSDVTVVHPTGIYVYCINPKLNVTRAEAVTMMNKVLGNPIAENAENPFGDVSPNHWAYNQIMTAVQGK